MSIFLVETKSKGLDVRPIRNMVNHETNSVFIDNLEIPAENLIGEEGKGFKVHPGRAQRRAHPDRRRMHRRWLLVHGEGLRVLERPRGFRPADRPEQGIQFLIAEAYMEIEAANLMRYKASGLFDPKKPLRRGSEHGEAPRRQASWEAANVCIQTHGGFGFAAEYDVERKFRESRLYPGGADLDQPDPVVPRRARARPAALVLALALRELAVRLREAPTSTRMKALLKPTWHAGVAMRSAPAGICITAMRPRAVTVVVRRSTLSE